MQSKLHTTIQIAPQPADTGLSEHPEGLTEIGGGRLWIVNHESPEHIASLRYMALLPAWARGEPVARYIAGMSAASFLDRWRPSILVLTKAFDPSILDLALAARDRRIRIVAVFCDDRSGNPDLHGLDRALASLADDIVVQTEAMALHVLRLHRRESTIIEEPYESPAGRPRFDPRNPIRLLWYGRFSNHDTLGSDVFPLIDAPDSKVELTVVTDSVTRHLVTLAQRIEGSKSASLQIREWSLECQARSLAQADLVLIPSLDRQDKRVKGHNRLVASIRAGVPALAYPLPAYRELSEFCWCGEDLQAGFSWTLAHPDAAIDRVRRGQSYIEGRFSIDPITRRWQQLFDGRPAREET